MKEHFKIHFKETRQGERVVSVIRRHWFILFRDIIGVVLLFLLPFIVIPIFLGMIAQSGQAITASAGLGVFFASLWSLLMWNILFLRWTDYYYDVWVLTDNRIVDIEQKGLFHRDIATLFDLNHIEDVKTIEYGIIGNLLHFGKIQIQTAGRHDEFVMDGISNPVHFERIIRETQHAHRLAMMHGSAGSERAGVEHV